MRVLFYLIALPLLSNPLQPNVRAGDVVCDGEGTSRLTLTSKSERAIVEWQEFSIDSHERVEMLLPSAHSAILNRVKGSLGTEIKGNLRSNGSVYLVNPKGIIISRDARVDTGAFIASTLDFSDAEFLNGGDLRFQAGEEGQIVQLGSIRARNGDLFLIASRVVQEGSLHAPRGEIGVVAAAEILLKPAGMSRIYIRPHQASMRRDCGIDQKGTLEALQTTLAADGSLYMMAICHTGNGDATQSLDLQAQGGRIEMGGALTVPGGKINIEADEFVMRRSAMIDAGDSNSGGSVAISTTLLFAEPDTYIGADSLERGAGGTVLLEGHALLSYSGLISARGGSLSGDGGTIILRGEGEIDPFGGVDLMAPHGMRGTIALEAHQATVGGPLPPFSSLLRMPRYPTLRLPSSTLSNWLSHSDVTLIADDSLVIAGQLQALEGALTLSTFGEARIAANAHIDLGGPFFLSAQRNLAISSGAHIAAEGSLTVFSREGDLNCQNATLTLQGSKEGTLLLAAGQSLDLKGSSIQNKTPQGALFVVADSKANHPPLFGSGHLSIDAASSLATSDGPLALYGARDTQIHVSALLNQERAEMKSLSVAYFPQGNPTGPYSFFGKLPWNPPTHSSFNRTFTHIFFAERFPYDRKTLYTPPVRLSEASGTFVSMIDQNGEKYIQ